MFEYIVYKTTNTVNNKIYIGVHRSPINDNDGYIGNGIYKNSFAKLSRKGFAQAVAKYGYEKFIRETLYTYPDTEEGKRLAYKKEAELVDRNFLKRKDVYNICLGGKIPSSTNEREIVQYDMQGNFIKSYYSIKHAAEMTNCSKSGIQAACSNKSYCNNYQWRYKSDIFSEEKISPAIIKEKRVFQYDLQGNYLHTYKSATEAASITLLNVSAISTVCLNKRSCAGGYYWSYKKSFDYVQKHQNTPIAVAKYTINGEFIRSYDSIADAARDVNVGKSAIRRCIQGKQYTCKNFI